MSFQKALGDIEIAMRVLQESNATENPVDTHYKSLNCELTLVDKGEKVFKVCFFYCFKLDLKVTKIHAIGAVETLRIFTAQVVLCRTASLFMR
jgi:hypothetical protein